MELRCPDCCSPEVEGDSQSPPEGLRCGNCGAGFQRDCALVTVHDAESCPSATAQVDLFAFDPELAVAQLRDPDGAIALASTYSDADELNVLVECAQEAKVIATDRERARLFVYPLSVGEPEPLLALDPGAGPTLLGGSVDLSQGEEEDPIAFTVRLLAGIVEEANGLAAEPAAGSRRLDRIVAYLNEHRPWSGPDVCEFLARELQASGRRLLDTGE